MKAKKILKKANSLFKSVAKTARQKVFVGSKQVLPAPKLNVAKAPDKAAVVPNVDASVRFNFANALEQSANNFPVSNGNRFHDKIKLKVAIVTDVYMYNYYKDCFEECVYLSPDNVDTVLIDGFDLFIYVTCWSGIVEDEWKGIQYRDKPATAFEKIINYCKKNDVITIFQSIEDPSNFDNFLPIAKKFDYVFTSDADIIQKYKENLGHDRVEYGEYGFNPALCNPIGLGRKPLNVAFFAGSYPSRYQERCQDMEFVFDSIIKSGGHLVIADRNFGSSNKDLQYPERFHPYLIRPFDHEVLQNIHKLFRYNLNFNSIKGSSTMCAMRVYELQATGREIISNYARSVFNKFPSIKLVPEEQDLSSYFADETDEIRSLERRLDCANRMLTDRTSYDMAAKMLTFAGLIEAPKQPKVAIILNGEDSKTLASVKRQSYLDIVTIDIGEAVDEVKWDLFVRDNDIRFFCYFDDSRPYSDEYVSRMLNAFKFTAADYVTIDASVADGKLTGRIHEYTNWMADKACSVFHVASCNPLDIAHLANGERKQMANGYAVDPFSLVNTTELKPASNLQADYALSVIVPVFNNGEFLREKCIESLLRSNTWDRTQVLLIDDGSTHDSTLAECESLASRFPNVELFKFPRGGSGSASRARNRGLELAVAPLVAFLDPDNEISLGGYDNLIRIYEECAERGEPVDFVSGYQVKVGAANSYTGRHTKARLQAIADQRERFFLKGKFPVISTQAAVINREFLAETGIRFVEGAAGQDTLFGWEILSHAKRIAFTSYAKLLYYYERESSVTNTIDEDYFTKKKILEINQVDWLRRSDLLDVFKDHHLDNFVKNWYLKKLELVGSADRPRSEQILCEILELYGVDPAVYGINKAA